MRKLVKHLRPFIWSILAIFVLLFGQAMSDLSLPSYMSRIVNVGIQQSGIESTVPQAIRASELSKLTLFMTDSEKKLVASHYLLLDSQSLAPADYTKYLKSYPQLAKAPIYKLNTSDKAQITQLDSVFGVYLPIVATIERGGGATFPGAPVQIPAGVDPFSIIGRLSPQQLEALHDSILPQLRAVSQSQVKLYSIAYISAEYKAIGINVSGIQTAYMLRIGLLMLLVTIAAALCSIAVGFLSARVAAGLGRNLRRQLFVRVESFSNTEFDRFSTASLITRTTNDITQIQMLMVMLVQDCLLRTYSRNRRHY